MDVERVAVTGIRVRQQRDARTIRERTANAEIFIECQDPAVRPAEEVLGNASAADRRGLVTGSLDEAHTKAVEYARQDQDLRCLNHPAKCTSVSHWSPISGSATARNEQSRQVGSPGANLAVSWPDLSTVDN